MLAIPYRIRSRRNALSGGLFRRPASVPLEAARRELVKIIDPDRLFEIRDTIDDLFKSLRPEMPALFHLELLRHRIILVGRHKTTQLWKEVGVLTGGMGTIHRNERLHRGYESVAVILIATGIWRVSHDGIRHAPARLVLSQQRIDQAHHHSGLLETWKDRDSRRRRRWINFTRARSRWGIPASQRPAGTFLFVIAFSHLCICAKAQDSP